MRLKFCCLLGPFLLAATAPPTTQPSGAGEATPGIKIPSEDPQVSNFHSLGLINGRADIFRCGSPVHTPVHAPTSATGSTTTRPVGLATTRSTTQQSLERLAIRMRHLHDDLGIRTDISLEDPNPLPGVPVSKNLAALQARMATERAAAEAAGITFVNHPMLNGGPRSFQTMSDDEVRTWVEPIAAEVVADAVHGGVMFHCAAGEDRTGILGAYLRMKYQGWPVDQAIAEMRRLGHDWTAYSNNGGLTSWHEDHLRAIAKMITAQ